MGTYNWPQGRLKKHKKGKGGKRWKGGSIKREKKGKKERRK